jgi:hypothetical protein
MDVGAGVCESRGGRGVLLVFHGAVAREVHAAGTAEQIKGMDYGGWGSKDSMLGIWGLAPIESTSQREGIWGEESRGRREKTCNLYSGSYRDMKMYKVRVVGVRCATPLSNT